MNFKVEERYLERARQRDERDSLLAAARREMRHAAHLYVASRQGRGASHKEAEDALESAALKLASTRLLCQAEDMKP